VNDEKLLANWMKSAALKLPFDDFEDTVMQRIRMEGPQQSRFYRDRKLSAIFFILGTFLGLVINSILDKDEHAFLGFSPETIRSVFQVTFVFTFLIILDSKLRFFKNLKKHN
jgi:hypothetical protein